MIKGRAFFFLDCEMTLNRSAVFLLSSFFLTAGCASHILVVQGRDCTPIEKAEIFYTRAGIESFIPYGPVYTDRQGKAAIPADVNSLIVHKEKFKSFSIEMGPVPLPAVVFLYSKSDDRESGLTNWNHCTQGVK